MSIKPDVWIKRMAESEGMIEPFSENQVRVDDKGEKLISYGVSSFGYDVRCANEFKVFTNIHSATVDPKVFDDNSFVELAVINDGVLRTQRKGSAGGAALGGFSGVYSKNFDLTLG